MYKNRGFNGTNNAKFMSSTMKFNENDVANRFKNYIINTFNIKHETVTKLDKSRVKQLYFQQFPTESQSNFNFYGQFLRVFFSIFLI